MRELIRARDESHRLSIQLALDTNDIPYTTNAGATTSGGYFMPMHFFVKDEDYERARELVLSLEPGMGPRLVTEPKPRRAIVGIVGAVMLLALVVMVLRAVTHH